MARIRKIFGDVSTKQMDATILVGNEVSAGTNERRRRESYRQEVVLTERNQESDYVKWQD
jgi:hypothetical protein